MQHVEVLIVGGGPAGSTCAWQLREAGADVLLLDKATFPRDKTCAGWITPPVVTLLRLDLEEYARSHVLQPITRFRTGLIDGPEIETDYGRVVSFGIRRCEFDAYLLRRAAVRTELGQPIDSLVRVADGWIVNGRWHTLLLVGAGGHFCPVARLVRHDALRQTAVVMAQEVEFLVAPDDEPRLRVVADCPELFFCHDLQGYGWCFRKGPVVNIGLGRSDAEGLTEQVQNFVEFLRQRQKVTFDLPVRFHGHAYALYAGTSNPLVANRVLLIGDSAGLAYPQSGEGIRPAVESARLAADVIRNARGDYSSAALAPYADRIVSRFGASSHSSSPHWLPASWLHFAARRVLASPWLTRSVVLDRWFLHANTPALAN